MIRRLRLLIGALALSCGTAQADEPAGQDVVYFSADGPVRVRFTATIDGRPAEAVWREALDKLFALCDRDGDGQLSQSEIPKFYPITGAAASTPVVQRNGFFADFGFVSSNTRVPRTRNMPNWFVKMDRNGDGDISRREFLGPAKLFRKLDADGDGLISPQEASTTKQ